ncbi:MAG: riboflavin biosynthesis protein RibF [Lentisphaeria bacterium]|nr:riboflavin biosynthesis protein RibF [Lentisphaeria bacterium]
MPDAIPTDLKQIADLAAYGIGRAVIAIGVFDGVHRGHRKLLTELLTVSAELDCTPVVMTFFPHPRSLLTECPPELLYSPDEKIRLLREQGVKAVVTVPFTREFAALPPGDFLAQSVFDGQVDVRGICVGRHWRFGAKAAGNAEFLADLAVRKKFRFSAVDELCLSDGQVVSSSAIREAIRHGDLPRAEQMLGRRYSLSGKVSHGYRQAGKRLDTPTANLEIEFGVLPPYGVYAGRAQLPDGRRFPAAVNIGVSPTFREQYGEIGPRVEVHLLEGFDEDIYGREIRLELAGSVRPERTFPDAAALKRQISDDIIRIKEILERS